MAEAGQRKKDGKYTEEYFLEEFEREKYIPTGSTMLNLACSNNPFGGLSRGRFTNIIGFTQTSKTVLAMSCLACLAGIEKLFDEYKLGFDDAEHAYDFDTEKMYGQKLLERLMFTDPPSDTIEDYFVNVLGLIKKGVPFINVLDSLDALTSEAEVKRGDKKYNKRTKTSDDESNKKEKGSYSLEKPKELSEMLRIIKKPMENMNSHLIIISQTRQNIGFGAMFKPLTRSGGDALHFYAFHEIWLAHSKQIPFRGLITGNKVEAKVEKNKTTGKRRSVLFDVYDGFGIDDIGSCVDFLISLEHWEVKKRTYEVPEFDLEGTREKIITYVEQEGWEDALRVLCAKVWNEREDEIDMINRGRKKRFE